MLFTYVTDLYSKYYVYRTYVFSIENKNVYHYAQYKLNKTKNNYIVRHAFVLVNGQYIRYDSSYNINEVIFIID